MIPKTKIDEPYLVGSGGLHKITFITGFCQCDVKMVGLLQHPCIIYVGRPRKHILNAYFMASRRIVKDETRLA